MRDHILLHINGREHRIEGDAAKVQLVLDDDRIYSLNGKLLFSDAKVDANTGQVTLRGEFPTAEERARVIREYGADRGLVQTLARLGEYVEALKV